MLQLRPEALALMLWLVFYACFILFCTVFWNQFSRFDFPKYVLCFCCWSADHFNHSFFLFLISSFDDITPSCTKVQVCNDWVPWSDGNPWHRKPWHQRQLTVAVGRGAHLACLDWESLVWMPTWWWSVYINFKHYIYFFLNEVRNCSGHLSATNGDQQ